VAAVDDVVNDYGDRYAPTGPPTGPEDSAARAAAVSSDWDAEERRLQALLVRQVPSAAAPLATINRRQGFQHPVASRVARFGWIIDRWPVRGRMAGRVGGRLVLGRVVTRRD
jgi:hypothetical protein